MYTHNDHKQMVKLTKHYLNTRSDKRETLPRGRINYQMKRWWQEKIKSYCQLNYPYDDLPIEALWIAFLHIADGTVDKTDNSVNPYLLRRSAQWEYLLNIYPEGHKHYDLNLIEKVLGRLYQAMYIDWYAQGSIWRIYIKKDKYGVDNGTK